MSVRAVQPEIQADEMLAGAQFIDAYSVTVAAPRLDARMAATRMFSTSPRWVDDLMRLRNLLVTPFGLKTPHRAPAGSVDRIGIFPVLSEMEDRLVAGLDDKHLDFRVAIDLAPAADGQCVTATTMVRTHNRLGRLYLAAILPFHRIVVRTMLRQLLDAP